jgi:hypothetical protein
MRATCPFCAHTADQEQLTSGRGPGRAWFRLQCVKCGEGFEYFSDPNQPKPRRVRRTREQHLNRVVGEFINLVNHDVICVGERNRIALMKLFEKANKYYQPEE